MKKIYMIGCLDTNYIEEFSFIQKLNDHARAKIKCIVDRECLEICSWQLLYREVQISMEGIKEPIFAGIIDGAEIEKEGERLTLFLNIVSGTYLLDQTAYRRSFGKRQGYKKLMEYILSNQGKAIYVAEDKDIMYPIIQFDETNWEFLKRLASNLGTSVTPDINSISKPRMYVGLRNGEDHKLYDTDHYKEIRKNEISSTLTYEVETYDDWRFGDRVQFKEKYLRICEKFGEIKNGELLFRYVLSTSLYSSRHAYHNGKLKGKEMIGKVIDTKGEWVKILAETEVFEENELSFYYKWMPETGNLLYCMPEIGTYVTLYFCNKSEMSGICINCVRKNKEEVKKYWEVEKKCFVLPDKKYLLLETEKMMVKGQGGELLINDETGINFISSHEVQVSAGEDILFNSGAMLANAPNGIDIVKKDILKPAIININNDFDIKGKIGRVEERLHYDDKEMPIKVFHGGKS